MLNKKKTAGLLGAVMTGIYLVFVGLYTYISSQSFMETAASQAGRMATELLATKVDLGRVEIVSWRDSQKRGKISQFCWQISGNRRPWRGRNTAD